MNSSSPIWVALIFQCALLVFVAVRLMAVESELSSGVIANGSPSLPTARALVNQPVAASRASAELDEEAVRLIIREEILAALAQAEDQAPSKDRGSNSANSSGSGSPRPTASIALSESEIVQRRQAYETAFAAAVSGGPLSNGEVAALEQNIARLPPAERTRALAELSKALSNGSIDARFE